MRLMLKQLREHIDQALNEMPLMSIQEPGTDKEWSDNKGADEDPEYYGSFESPEDPDAQKNKRAVHRFYKQPKFVDDAIRLYRNLSIPVYIVPAWSGRYGADHSRSSSVGPGGAPAALKNYGVSDERAQELAQAVKNGAAVFVPLASRLERNQLPTPWMLVHALFDGNVIRGPLGKLLEKVMIVADELDSIAYGMASKSGQGNHHEVDDKVNDVYKAAFTFAAARNKKINSENDLAAEIMTQAVLTTKGFVYNSIGDESFDRQLEKMAKLASQARELFEKTYAGKVTVIDVNLEV